MPKLRNTTAADMAAEYDFSQGVRGKHAARFALQYCGDRSGPDRPVS